MATTVRDPSPNHAQSQRTGDGRNGGNWRDGGDATSGGQSPKEWRALHKEHARSPIDDEVCGISNQDQGYHALLITTTGPPYQSVCYQCETRLGLSLPGVVRWNIITNQTGPSRAKLPMGWGEKGYMALYYTYLTDLPWDCIVLHML